MVFLAIIISFGLGWYLSGLFYKSEQEVDVSLIKAEASEPKLYDVNSGATKEETTEPKKKVVKRKKPDIIKKTIIPDKKKNQKPAKKIVKK